MDGKSSRQTPTFSDNNEERLKPIYAQGKAVKFSKPENIFEKLVIYLKKLNISENIFKNIKYI